MSDLMVVYAAFDQDDELLAICSSKAIAYRYLKKVLELDKEEFEEALENGECSVVEYRVLT